MQKKKSIGNAAERNQAEEIMTLCLKRALLLHFKAGFSTP